MSKEAMLKQIESYRQARDAMIEMTAAAFPPGTRVQPIGTTTGNWGATVRKIDQHHRRELSADMVFLDWDNGNKFPCKIDEIEIKSDNLKS